MNGIEIVARNPIFFKITTPFENILEATMDTAVFGTHLSFLIVDSQKFEHSCRLGRRFDLHYGQGLNARENVGVCRAVHSPLED